MAQRVVDRDLGFRRIVGEIIEDPRWSLLVGIQESAKVKPEIKGDRKSDSGASVAQYAAYNEFGTEKIPERSFMRTAFDENINRIESILNFQYGKFIDGEQSLRQALGLTGTAIVGMIQIKIRQIHNPPNSPETIARKGSSKPLIDFGQMVRSVTYAIRQNR